MTAPYIILAIAGYLAVGVGVAVFWLSGTALTDADDKRAGAARFIFFWPIYIALLPFLALVELALYLGDKCIERKKS